jgi:type VI secretion system secreted protein VgrG
MDALSRLGAALGVFGTGLGQHARLITLASAQASNLPESLVVEQFTGREAVNELFRFDVDALSTSTNLQLASFIGEELSLNLLQADGTRRAWHGICTDAAWLGADGGVARYRLRLEPALAALRLRRDSYIFQDLDASAIITELLADYPQVRFDFDITQTLGQRAVCTQYRSSDLEFFTRLLADEGLSFRFEHDQEGDAASDTPSTSESKHRLVIFDAHAQAPAMPGVETLRFHGVRATDTMDAIDHFGALRQVMPNAVAISSWDPTQLVAVAAEQATSLAIGDLPSLAVYRGDGERRYLDADTAGLRSTRLLQALELDNKAFNGGGAVRQLAAGHVFQLTQHGSFAAGDDRFIVLAVEHAARNNLEAALSKVAAGGLERGTYRNTFTCVRDTVAIVPRALPPARTSGSQTALIVGLPDAIATTDRDHQVKIQFAWQRGAVPNAGGLEHGNGDPGNAPGNEASGTWVRVAEALAGPNWGGQFIPRIGTEVLVDFIDGDMDRPIIVGQLYTGSDLPPYSAGVDSGVEHAGVLSGYHTNNFDGGGFNQLVTDDTPGQLRTRLATSSAATELNLGYLVAHNAKSAQRGSYRGNGFELRTDAWGMLRGGEGLLVSTSARARNGSSVTSTQLDAAEAVGMLKGASALATTLIDAATAQNALASKAANEAQSAFLSQIDPEENGKYSGAVGGHSALKATAGSRDLDAEQPVEKFATPVMLFDGASSINWASPASTVVFAGGQLQWTAQSDMQWTAGHTISAVAANAIGLFTHSGGIQAIAANGPVSLQAHTDQLEILADKEITIISVNDVIEIKANQKIVLQAGQSSVTLEGGDITFACPGNFTVKGGQHVFDGGQNRAALMNKLPDSRLQLFDEAFILRNRITLEPMARQPYRLKRADGTYEDGFTDETGQTHLVTSATNEDLTVELLQSKKEVDHGSRELAPIGSVSKYKVAGKTVTTPVALTKRSEILIDSPECWIEDHESEVNTSVENYAQTSTLNGNIKNRNRFAKFKIYVPSKSNMPVVIEVRFKITPEFLSFDEEMRLTSEEKEARIKPDLEKAEPIKVIAERGISAWNRKYQLEILDPNCGKRVLPIEYKIVWVDANEHLSVSVSANKIRESVSPGVMSVSLSSEDFVYTHEFGHVIGLPDEYSTDPDNDLIVKYYKPDGTLDKPLVALAEGKTVPQKDANLMNSAEFPVFLPRHAWNVAIEAQTLLTKEIGREIKCKIIA